MITKKIFSIVFVSFSVVACSVFNQNLSRERLDSQAAENPVKRLAYYHSMLKDKKECQSDCFLKIAFTMPKSVVSTMEEAGRAQEVPSFIKSALEDKRCTQAACQYYGAKHWVAYESKKGKSPDLVASIERLSDSVFALSQDHEQTILFLRSADVMAPSVEILQLDAQEKILSRLVKRISENESADHAAESINAHHFVLTLLRKKLLAIYIQQDNQLLAIQMARAVLYNNSMLVSDRRADLLANIRSLQKAKSVSANDAELQVACAYYAAAVRPALAFETSTGIWPEDKWRVAMDIKAVELVGPQQPFSFRNKVSYGNLMVGGYKHALQAEYYAARSDLYEKILKVVASKPSPVILYAPELDRLVKRFDAARNAEMDLSLHYQKEINERQKMVVDAQMYDQAINAFAGAMMSMQANLASAQGAGMSSQQQLSILQQQMISVGASLAAFSITEPALPEFIINLPDLDFGIASEQGGQFSLKEKMDPVVVASHWFDKGFVYRRGAMENLQYPLVTCN